MPRYTGPGRFTAQGGNALSRSRVASLQAEARKIVGDLENQVKLGNIWYGRRTIKINDIASVIATVDATFPDNPLIQAVLILASPKDERDEIPVERGGIVWQFGTDDLFFTAQRRDQQVSFSVFSNNADVESSVTTSLEDIPSYIPSLFNSKIEAGEIDWQDNSGNVISWNGPNSRSIIPIGTGLTAFGSKIYKNGVVLYEFTALEKVIGAAEVDTGTLIAIVVDSNDDFVAYTIDLSTEALTTEGFFDNNQNGVAFHPRSPAFFNLSGTEATTIIDNLENFLADERDEVWAELKFSTGSGFTVEEYFRPRVYEYVSKLNTSGSGVFTVSTSTFTDNWSTTGTYSIEFTDVSQDFGQAWATPTNDRPICVDYTPSGVERRAVMRRTTPRAEGLLDSYSQSYSATDTYEGSLDEERGVVVGGRTNSRTLDRIFNESLSMTLIPDEVEILIDDVVVATLPGYVYEVNYNEQFDDSQFFSVSYPLEVGNSGSIASGSITTVTTTDTTGDEASPVDRLLFYVDARFEVVGVVNKFTSDDYVEDVVDSLSGSFSNAVWDDIPEVWREASALLKDVTDITTVTPFLNIDTKLRVFDDTQSVQETPIVSDFGFTQDSNVTLQPVSTGDIGFPGEHPYVLSDEITDLGFYSDAIPSDQEINNITGNARSTYIGSGARHLFEQANILDHATASNPAFFIDLLRVDAWGAINELEHYRILKQELQPIVFPVGSFNYILKNV